MIEISKDPVYLVFYGDTVAEHYKYYGKDFDTRESLLDVSLEAFDKCIKYNERLFNKRFDDNKRHNIIQRYYNIFYKKICDEEYDKEIKLNHDFFKEIQQIYKEYKDIPEFTDLIKNVSSSNLTKNVFYTYFLLDKDKNIVKIGKSMEPQKRINSIKAMNCNTLIFLGYITLDIENKLHRQFKHLRVKGEWFIYNDELKKEINKLLEKHKQLKLIA